MRAVIYRRFGPAAEVLETVDLPDPEIFNSPAEQFCRSSIFQFAWRGLPKKRQG